MSELVYVTLAPVWMIISYPMVSIACAFGLGFMWTIGDVEVRRVVKFIAKTAALVIGASIVSMVMLHG